MYWVPVFLGATLLQHWHITRLLGTSSLVSISVFPIMIIISFHGHNPPVWLINRSLRSSMSRSKRLCSLTASQKARITSDHGLTKQEVIEIPL